jgi:hypothetical protein
MSESADATSRPMSRLSRCAAFLRAFCRKDVALVLGLTLLGLVLRLTGISFGLPCRCARPDEDYIVDQAFALLRNHSVNSFSYPSAYMDLAALAQAIYYLAGRVTGRFAGPEDVNLEWHVDPTSILEINRGLSAFLGALTIPLVYWLGTRALGRRQGLLAACFVSVAYLEVRESHFATTDAMLTMMCVLSLLVIHWAADGDLRRLLLAALVVGLSISTKYTAAALAVPLGMACLVRAPGTTWGQALGRIAGRALLCTVGVPAGFLLATPYVLWRWSDFDRDVSELFADKTSAGAHLGIDVGRGWSRHFSVNLWYGLGWPLLFAAVVGLGVLLAQRRRSAFPIIAFAVAYWAQMASSFVVFARYALPLVPPACLFAAEAVTTLETMVSLRHRKILFAGASVLLLALPLYRSLQLDVLLLREDSRVQLGRWVEERVPRGATLGFVGALGSHAPLLSHPDQIERSRLYWVEKTGGDGRGTRRFAEFVKASPRPSYIRWRNHQTQEGWADFLTGEAVHERRPDYIILPDYPIFGPRFLRDGAGPWLDELLKAEYRMVLELRTWREGPMLGDVQDLFFLPYSGLQYVDRPGPGFRVYQRERR